MRLSQQTASAGCAPCCRRPGCWPRSRRGPAETHAGGCAALPPDTQWVALGCKQCKTDLAEGSWTGACMTAPTEPRTRAACSQNCLTPECVRVQMKATRTIKLEVSNGRVARLTFALAFLHAVAGRRRCLDAGCVHIHAHLRACLELVVRLAFACAPFNVSLHFLHSSRDCCARSDARPACPLSPSAAAAAAAPGPAWASHPAVEGEFMHRPPH